MNYGEILIQGENLLKKNKIKNPYLDAELILSKVLNRGREEIILNNNKKIKNKDIIKFKNYISRRKENEPVAYILGFKHFWKYKFIINKSVLIPRPDTELIIDETLKYLPNNKSKKILDIGTGSGCIIVSLLSSLKDSFGIGIDISNDAILVVKKDQTQSVKALVEYLKKKGDSRATVHKTIFRPWGNYTSVADGFNWQVKKIIVNSGESLSLQMHNHRTEHWIIVDGTALVEINGEENVLNKNESIYIPLGAKHRLSNNWQKPLILIEVQSGDYLGEDDIIRFEDKYGR